MRELKALFGGLSKVFKGPRYDKQDFLSTIFLVSRLMKMLRTDGPVAVEPHIEDPKASPIFAEYPKLLKDETLIHLICDTLRLVVVSSGTLDPHAVEEVMDNAIKTHHHDAIRPANTLQNLADALPALGIVAAVLGVVKTMSSIDQPPAILGEMIGSAASHAWLSVLVPGTGWVDIDPTNRTFVDQRFVTTAWGRDYADISPINGVIFGGGRHDIEVAVDVEPVLQPDEEQRRA